MLSPHGVTTDEADAMRRALVLAATPGIRPGVNPRVGCVLLRPDGGVVAEGTHRGAGTPHAEVEALERAGGAARGATAVVTLEPCDHTGRTGPCTQALLAAGIARVVFAQTDPHAVAAGGAATLRAAGVDVEGGLLADQAEALNLEWAAAVTLGRPHVTWKYAASLDGRSAAADGSSRWVSGPESRHEVHERRRAADAVVVGTGTVTADDPRLTVRVDGEVLPYIQQPVRVVVGRRPVPAGARVLDDSAPTFHLTTHDVDEVLTCLWDTGIRRVLLEGGPTLAGAFWRADRVDRVVGYVAPALLGAGAPALVGTGITTIADAVRLELVDVARVGADIRLVAVPTARRSP
ncbi:MAG TPA: bifunctional diaminohydroxyphosphoribosylaminopyrimidine deaminase/5-amino-6-(5-phosphoribosylamino)uracil reductase RibD [Actinomycetales bacterium]|nr:bifunctional diaminohydroxyphosphoribosylaminopyrimidine deaminase/5-amino-6-(5-phosphoribosylamino)uracil reductase RibD [Actinomycetales bacterium]